MKAGGTMADEFTNELAQAAQRVAAALRPKTPAGLTIKLVSGDIKSVATDGSSAVVDVGEGDINALNKSGDRLAAGESVWLGYTKSLADAVILFRAGVSKPGVGEDLGNGNERFNDYTNNTVASTNASMNTLKGENNTVGGAFNDTMISGKNNSVNYGGGSSNSVSGQNNSINSAANNNTVSGSYNQLYGGMFDNNAVFGSYNSISAASDNNTVCGIGNELNIATNNNVCGSNNKVSGSNNVVGGANNLCVDSYSAVFGEGNLVGYKSIAAGGSCCTGYSSIAVGENCVAGLPDGVKNASDKKSYYNSARKTVGSVAFGHVVTIEDGYRFGCGQYNNYEATAIFQIGDGTSDNDKRNAFEVRYNGNAYIEGSYETLGADYAEYEEWLDGNPDNEDRAGHFVTYEGSKIRYANADDDYILGVVSAKPAIIGDSDIGYWRKKYQTDIFGRVVYENGAPKISAEYDTQQAYILRAERAEWSPVGTHGKLIVIDDGTCIPNGYCRPTDGGIGTAAMTGNGAYRVLERLDSTHVKIRIK
jgi:hypothetical protein